jgi:hypothetical protein
MSTKSCCLVAFAFAAACSAGCMTPPGSTDYGMGRADPEDLWGAADFTRLKGNVNVILGGRMVLQDKAAWDPTSGMFEGSVNTDLAPEKWPINFAGDVSGAIISNDDKGTVVDASAFEIDLGVRWVMDHIKKRPWHPYVGVGPAFVYVNRQESQGGATITTIDTWAVGGWANAGIYYTFNGHFNFGLDFKYTYAKASGVQAGALRFGLLMGYRL